MAPSIVLFIYVFVSALVLVLVSSVRPLSYLPSVRPRSTSSRFFSQAQVSFYHHHSYVSSPSPPSIICPLQRPFPPLSTSLCAGRWLCFLAPIFLFFSFTVLSYRQAFFPPRSFIFNFTQSYTFYQHFSLTRAIFVIFFVISMPCARSTSSSFSSFSWMPR